MARAAAAQVAFNSGEISKNAEGRIDIDKYPSSVRSLINWIPQVLGPAKKRPGSVFVKEVKNSAHKGRLLPFRFSTTQAYVIQLGNLYAQIYKEEGVQLDTAVVITTTVAGATTTVNTAAAHGHTIGDQVFISGTGVVELDGKYHNVATTPTAVQFTVSTTSAGAGAGGTTEEVVELRDAVGAFSMPYLQSEVEDIQIAQSADVLYVAHPNHPRHKITRTSDTVWTSEDMDAASNFGTDKHPPFAPENTDRDMVVYVSSPKGTGITIKSNVDIFTSDIVGQFIKISDEPAAHYQPWQSGRALTGGNTQALRDFEWGSSKAYPNIGMQYHHEGNVYEANQIVGSGTFQGIVPPTHLEGVVGDGVYQLRYVNSGSGYAQIKTFVNARHLTADVVVEFPRSVSTEWIDDLGTSAGDFTITNVTAANPVSVTIASPHTIQTGDRVYVTGIVGMTEINDRLFTVTQTGARLGSATFTLDDEDGSGHTAYISGGEAAIVTDRWAVSAFGSESGYPRSVTFFEDRLCWGGAGAAPETLFCSVQGDYENHRTGAEADKAITATLNTDPEVNLIEWITSGSVLTIGTAGGEATFGAANSQESLKPENARAFGQTSVGSRAGVSPIRIQNAVLFVEASGRTLREFVFDAAESNAYIAPIVNRLADHILLKKVQWMAFQQQPNRIVWFVLEDGSLVALTYEPVERVFGFHRHELGGTDVAVDSIAVIPNPEGDADQIWLVVSRTINGGTKRYVEFLDEDWFEGKSLTTEAVFLDSAIKSTTAGTAQSGLEHLEGETVWALIDGVHQGPFDVTAGSITLTTALVTQGWIGLLYESTVITSRLEAGAEDGVAQAQPKKIDHVVFRVDEMGPGLRYGEEGKATAALDEVDFNQDFDDVASGVTLASGDTVPLDWPGGIETGGRMKIVHNLPYPATLVAVFPQLQTHQRP